jgi:putative intracellular protease/amidase
VLCVVRTSDIQSNWHDNGPEDIKRAGGIYEDEEVVVDGNLVTSRWPMDLAAFNREMMKLIGIK